MPTKSQGVHDTSISQADKHTKQACTPISSAHSYDRHQKRQQQITRRHNKRHLDKIGITITSACHHPFPPPLRAFPSNASTPETNRVMILMNVHVQRSSRAATAPAHFTVQVRAHTHIYSRFHSMQNGCRARSCALCGRTLRSMINISHTRLTASLDTRGGARFILLNITSAPNSARSL